MTPKLSRELYFAFIYSKLKYAIEVYGNCSSTNINKMQILQNKLMKMLLKLDRRTSTNYLNKMLNICNVNDIYVVNVVYYILYMKISVTDVLMYLRIISNLEEMLMMWGGRDKLKFQQPFGDRAIKIHGASLWNKLHTSVVPFRLKNVSRKRWRSS